MKKGNGVMGEGRRWAVDLTDISTSPYSRDFPNPLGISRDDSTVSHRRRLLNLLGKLSMGSCTGHIQEFDDDGFHDVDGWEHGNVSDITFSNIHMSTRCYDHPWWGRAEPIYVTTCPRHSKSKEGSISNLFFVNITSTSENGVFLSGSKGGLLSDLRFINLDLTYRRWTNNDGGLVDYRPGCQGLVKHNTAGIIMEHINGLVIDNVNMRWSDDPLRQWNDSLDFRSTTVNNISLLNFHSSLYKQ
ncbi:unnamed protein product [Malus baccata var. baccata]